MQGETINIAKYRRELCRATKSKALPHVRISHIQATINQIIGRPCTPRRIHLVHAWCKHGFFSSNITMFFHKGVLNGAR